MGQQQGRRRGEVRGLGGSWLRRLALVAATVATVAGVLVFDPAAPPAAAQRVEPLDITVRAAQYEEDIPGRAGTRCRQIYYWSIPYYAFADQILVQFILPNYGSVTSPTNENVQATTIIPGSERAAFFQAPITEPVTLGGRPQNLVVVPAPPPGAYQGGFRSSYGDPLECGVVPSWVPGYSTSPSFVAWFGPTPAFSWEVTDPKVREVTFTDGSIDEDGGRALIYSWNFGDGGGSSERDPVHRFPAGGSYPVSLTVTQADGESETLTQIVEVPAGSDQLVVNSTGDAAAEDPAEGCDTGATVGTEPECTLRAAIEVANDRGGDEITFAIAGGGTPTIETTSALPPVTSSSTIDGTTQAGGFVAVAASGSSGIDLDGGSSTVRGLIIDGAQIGVLARSGEGHLIEGNRLGVDAAGSAGTTTGLGVGVGAPATVVRGNVSAAQVGVGVIGDGAGTEVVDNLLGVDDDGATPLGEPRAGVVVRAGDVDVDGNVVRGSSIGIGALGAEAEGASITDNHVGVTGSGGAVLSGTGVPIRVDAASEVTVSGNQVAGEGEGAIQVTGSAQFTVSDSGDIELLQPSDDEQPGVRSGRAVTVAGNTVGVAGAEDPIGWGVVGWAGADDLTIATNTVLGATVRAIQVDGGAGLQVTGNELGTVADPVDRGIYVFGVEDATLGGVGEAGNDVVAETAGIFVNSAAGTSLVQGNDVQIVGDEPESGILVSADTEAPTIAGNEVRGAATGLATDAPDAVLSGNVVEEGMVGIDAGGARASVRANDVVGQTEAGIDTAGDGATVDDNAVTSSGVGLRLAGDDLTAEDNRVGLTRVGVTVVGNDGTGISVLRGSGLLRGNEVAGSGSDGIEIAQGAEVELRRNRVWQSADEPIVAPGGPDAPRLVAAVRTGSGETLRRTLLLADLPAGDAGTIEVFANSSCDDPEAEHVMSIERTKLAEETDRIVQVREAPDRDHFTVTYTSADGRTSELSNCVSGATYEDADGDGSVDPFDGVLGGEDDASVATVATDTEQLLALKLVPFDPETKEGGGSLESVSIGADPAPDAHPEGWGLPYGAISFRISGLAPGGRTTLTMAAISGTDAIAGNGYWKYGPQTPGGPSAWYPFTADEATRTGATQATLDFAGKLRPVYVLRFADGLRGDSDGGANGSITDPGGPVFFEGDVPPTTTTTTVTTSSTSTTTAPTSTTAGGSGSTTVASTATSTAPAPTGVDDGTLARTGGDARGPVLLGAGLLLAGATVLVARRRRLAR